MVASVLTNNAAMVALQTLRSTNMNLTEVNSQISTGKKVATAKDSAAVFAITATMRSDVAGFEAISDSLALGSSTLAVGSNALNQIGDLLDDIKGKIVAANEDNVDRATLQDEIVELRNQITGITDAAQFNGLNLLKSDAETSILSSLDRASSGAVSTSNISVQGRNFATDAGTAGTAAGGFNASLSGSTITPSTSTAIFTSAVDLSDTIVTVAGFEIEATTAALTAAGLGTTDEDVAAFFVQEINALGLEGVTATTQANTGTPANAELTVTSSASAAVTVLADSGASAGTLGAFSTATIAATSGATNTAATAVLDLNLGFANGAGDTLTLTVGDNTFTYTAAGTDTNVAGTRTNALAALQQSATDQGITNITFAAGGAGEIVVSNSDSTQSFDVSVVTTGFSATDAAMQSPTLGAATTGSVDIGISGNVIEGESYAVTIGTVTSTYVAGKNETANDVIRGLQAVIAANGPSGVTTALTFSSSPTTTAATISISSESGETVSVAEARGGTQSTGELYGLSTIDVSTAAGAEAALTAIESVKQIVVGAQADFGASESRVSNQASFMSSLIDSFKSGIGALVDADLEEASARLQSLQVQQQLGIQALSIANQAPQNILALFR